MDLNPRPKQIALLGSTGSIGENSLDVIRRHPDRFRVRYLTAHRNVEKLAAWAKELKPKGVVVTDPAQFKTAENRLRGVFRVLTGMEGILEIVQDPEIDLVLNALVGDVGVLPTYRAIQAGKNVALANKETLVAAGQLIMKSAREKGVRIFPIDSEHSAIWQCLVGEERKNIRRIILTASGGPFRTWTADQLEHVTVEQALRHPNWKMGAKITIDSATLMNKGLEVIEAYWLYDVSPGQIEVVVHPQSIIHSMVEFVDGSVKAQLGVPDMRIPIQYALSYPERLPLTVETLSFDRIKSLSFEKPDFKKFPCLEIAFRALEQGGTAPAVMNAANEVAVSKFLGGEIGFLAIPALIEKTLEKHTVLKEYDLKILLEVQRWAKEFVQKI
ncbi:MAG TPA: 1-deoxy-D-xylulose-5-phosphate reductoisomerase [Caldithrix sp.]|nr:1-deoxy-D-xylulose-5-phosphate reductoisomerase [Caldithrix sp.]